MNKEGAPQKPPEVKIPVPVKNSEGRVLEIPTKSVLQDYADVQRLPGVGKGKDKEEGKKNKDSNITGGGDKTETKTGKRVLAGVLVSAALATPVVLEATETIDVIPNWPQHVEAGMNGVTTSAEAFESMGLGMDEEPSAPLPSSSMENPAVIPEVSPSPSVSESVDTDLVNEFKWAMNSEEEKQLDQKIQDFLSKEGEFTEENLSKIMIWDNYSWSKNKHGDDFEKDKSTTKLGVIEVQTKFPQNVRCEFILFNYCMNVNGDLVNLVGYENKNGERKLTLSSFPKEDSGAVNVKLASRYIGANGPSVVIEGKDKLCEVLSDQLYKPMIILVTPVVVNGNDFEESVRPVINRFNSRESMESVSGLLSDIWIVDGEINKYNQVIKECDLDQFSPNITLINNVQEYKARLAEGKTGIITNCIFTCGSSK